MELACITSKRLREGSVKMIYQNLAGLFQKALEVELIEAADMNYVRNQVINLLGLEAFPEGTIEPINDTIPNLVENLITCAVEQGRIADVFDDKEILSANIMDCFVARPSVVNAIFNQKYNGSPTEATDFFIILV